MRGTGAHRKRPIGPWPALGRWRYALAAAILAAGILIALAAGGQLRPKDRTWERIQAEGIIQIGLEASFAPFEMIDPGSGQAIGFDVDLAVALGQELGGIRPRFVNVGFDSLYDQLLAGRFDAIISALPVDRVWTEDVRYSLPYFEAGLVMVARADIEPTIEATADLSGKRVSVEWGSEADAYGRQLNRRVGGIDLLPRETPQDALEAVREGSADVALVDAVSAYVFIGDARDLTVVGAPLTEVSYAIATRRTSPVLARELDEALARLRAAGTLDELLAKWL